MSSELLYKKQPPKQKSRTFTLQDQFSFAELSGDYNPIHIDTITARRLLYATPVVHGIHALLWALNSYLENVKGIRRISSLKAVFPEPIKIGETVALSVNTIDNLTRIKLESGTSVTTIIDLVLEEDESGSGVNTYIDADNPGKLKPRILSEHEIKTFSDSLKLHLNINLLDKLLPNLSSRLSTSQIAVILATSRLVGNICPGLHSLYSELELFREETSVETQLNFAVVKFNQSFRQVSLNLSAPELRGTIKSFLRPKPTSQKNSISLQKNIISNEFTGQRALIIGGSRGLGELAAKLLGCGGAEVEITYFQGKADTDRVVNDIVSNGGKAGSFCFNVLSEGKNIPDRLKNEWIPTQLYYFATPSIFTGAKGFFSPSLFKQFCDYYVVGFTNIVNQLSGLGLKQVFYPSSVAIDELPGDMGEYAAAKVAGELYCDYLEKNVRKMVVHRPRFPRVATDQTATIMPINNQDPVPIMLKELRTLRDSLSNV